MDAKNSIKIHFFERSETVVNKETGILKPEPRSGHRIVADDGNLYSIGGYNPDFWGAENNDNTNYPLFKELWQYNFATRKWIELSMTGPMPVELASHSALLLHGHHLVVFGGTGVPFGDSATNKLTLCDLHRKSWHTVKCHGDFPIRVYGQSMNVHNNQLYIFGGTTGWEYNSQLHKLDLYTREWSVIEASGEIPEGRYRHEVACHDNKLYVFGGGRSYLCYGFEKIPVFDFESNVWKLVPTVSDRTHGFPLERRCHSCVKLNKAVYICGGYDGESIFGDIWRFCLETLRWTKLAAVMPEPSYFHSAAVTPAGYMLIYGGVTEIDNVRTSNIYSIWLEPPSSLRELCWATLIKTVPHLDQISKQVLLELGIPSTLVSRIYTTSSSGISSPGGAGPSVCG